MKNCLTLFFLLFYFFSYSQSAQINLQKEFAEKNLIWPPTEVFIRAFKYEKTLETWVKSDSDSYFTLFKTYKICMLSGKLGPKRWEGDLQVPEGFYSINHYNIYSQYYLSLGINYPNRSDILLSKSTCKGGLIYIHGECVSVGCIAMGNKYIEEIYVLARITHNNGKTVQVHIFPFNFNQTPLFVTNYYQSREMKTFLSNLTEGFYYFESKKQLPKIDVDSSGTYLFSDEVTK